MYIHIFSRYYSYLNFKLINLNETILKQKGVILLSKHIKYLCLKYLRLNKFYPVYAPVCNE